MRYFLSDQMDDDEPRRSNSCSCENTEQRDREEARKQIAERQKNGIHIYRPTPELRWIHRDGGKVLQQGWFDIDHPDHINHWRDVETVI